MNKAWRRREGTHEKDMHKMQQGEKGNGIPVHQSSWTKAASILVRPLHEGVLQGVSFVKGQEMRPNTAVLFGLSKRCGSNHEASSGGGPHNLDPTISGEQGEGRATLWIPQEERHLAIDSHRDSSASTEVSKSFRG